MNFKKSKVFQKNQIPILRMVLIINLHLFEPPEFLFLNSKKKQ